VAPADINEVYVAKAVALPEVVIVNDVDTDPVRMAVDDNEDVAEEWAEFDADAVLVTDGVEAKVITDWVGVFEAADTVGQED
jgi:hypothetical protein